MTGKFHWNFSEISRSSEIMFAVIVVGDFSDRKAKAIANMIRGHFKFHEPTTDSNEKRSKFPILIQPKIQLSRYSFHSNLTSTFYIV